MWAAQWPVRQVGEPNKAIQFLPTIFTKFDRKHNIRNVGHIVSYLCQSLFPTFRHIHKLLGGLEQFFHILGRIIPSD